MNLLAGVRVVETAVLFNGDQTGRLLGDLGADVIKVEPPGEGDPIRTILGELTPQNSPSHLLANRNKRSVTIDLKSGPGRAVFFDLIRTADIFVDGFAGSTASRLGIGYDAQRRVKPDIIYAQCSGFGARGPYAEIPTHGLMMGALVGSIDFEVDQAGRANDVAMTLGDGSQVGALYTALTAIAALARRDRTGEGCCIDVAGADAVLATAWLAPLHEWNAQRMHRLGTVEPMGGARYRAYVTADDRLLLFCCAERKFWERFCVSVDRPDLLPRFDGYIDYGNNDDVLISELAKVVRSKTLADWMTVAVEQRLPIAPANRCNELKDDPQLRDRGIIYSECHPEAGAFDTIGWPAILSSERFDIRRHAPSAGEHTFDVLTELGYDEAAIRELETDRLI